ncbi:EF_hand domain-containing protein [Hexamita inflata]|uniref:EF hand domain-containing protein n=1 Tax=Hexamita inflata TaxID=28002 RepID=A0AA86U8H7_9EUKA|nr:EF hand domain-containing protein [Hexamita inflata]
MGTDQSKTNTKFITTDPSGITRCSDEFAKKLFDSYDLDRNQSIDAEELVKALTQLGQNMDDAAIEKLTSIIAVVDENENQVLEFDEFRNFLYTFLNAKTDDIKSILFFSYDWDQSATIDQNELYLILKRLGCTVDQEQINLLTKQVSDNVDNTFSYHEFLKLMAKLGVK